MGKELRKLLLLVVLATTAATAAAPAAAQQDGITGFITDLSGTTVLIEENPVEQSGSAKAYVEITAETQIFREQGGELVPVTPEDLEIGQLVEATFVGPVAESYPVQATAGSITVLEAPNGPGGAGDAPSGGGALPDTGGATLPAPGALLAGACILAGVFFRRARPIVGRLRLPIDGQERG